MKTFLWGIIVLLILWSISLTEKCAELAIQIDRTNDSIIQLVTVIQRLKQEK